MDFFKGKVHTRRIAEMLGREYPAMFKCEDIGPVAVPAYTGYGLGGLKGLKGLPDRICNMVQDLDINYLKLVVYIIFSVQR